MENSDTQKGWETWLQAHQQPTDHESLWKSISGVAHLTNEIKIRANKLQPDKSENPTKDKMQKNR